MKIEDFIYYTHEERDEALEINPEIKVDVIEDSGMWYVWCENVFKNLEKAIKFLQTFPAYDRIVTVPGSRQYFTAVEVEPLTNLIQEISEKMYVNRKFERGKFCFGSIISSNKNKTYENSWIPHVDYGDLTSQLYLTDYNGGTGLYKYKGYIAASDVPVECIRPHYYKDISYGGKYHTGKIGDWKKFDGDEDWELYHVIPSKKNCMGVFHGGYFHSTYAELKEDIRYVLSSFYRMDFHHSGAESHPIILDKKQ